MDTLNKQIESHNKLSNQIETYLATEDLQTILLKDVTSRTEEETHIFQTFVQILETHKEQGEQLQVARDLSLRIKRQALENLKKMVPEAVDHYQLDSCVE
jgi:hypothetical protein